jgi:CheY-like chemotaxis protein
MPKKILLADDSITIQKVVELTFSDGDYEVTAVNNGAKAVQKLAEMRPDIILSDIIMPEKNGYEVCEYVKSHPEFRNIPVVLLTGTFEPFDPDRAEKAGCDAVVTKPFESQSLIHKVEELIAQAQAGANASANASAPAAAPAPPPAAEASSPWMDDNTAVTNDGGVSFSTAGGSGFPIPAPEPFTHDNDIFAAAPPMQATTEMPFEAPPTPSGSDTPFGDEPASDAFGGETRAFPRMTFEQMQQMAAGTPPPPPAPAPEPSPWDEPAQFSGETRAFEKMSFDDFPPPAPAPEPEADSPFGAPPPPEEFSNETRAFTRMSIEEMRQMAAAEAAPNPTAAAEAAPNSMEATEPITETPAAAPEPSPWGEADAPAFGGETRAFPKLSFDDFSEQPAPAADTPAMPAWEPAAFDNEAASPFGNEADAPAFGGETRAFPKLNFDDFQAMGAPPAPDPQPDPQVSAPLEAESEPAFEPQPEPSAWDAAPEAAPLDEAPAASPFEDDAASPFTTPAAFDAPAAFEAPEPPTFAEPAAAFEESSAFGAPVDDDEPVAPTGYSDQPVPEDLPFSTESTVEADLPAADLSAAAEEPSWSLHAGAAESAEAQDEPDEPAAPPAALALEAPPMPIAAPGENADLSDEQVDRIARRVVELLSDQVVRNIAWEVIPDLAEMVVKERIRQLEAEA